MPRVPHVKPLSSVPRPLPTFSPAAAAMRKRIRSARQPWYRNIGWLDILLPAALLAALLGAIMGVRDTQTFWGPAFEGTAILLVPSLLLLLPLHHAAIMIAKKLHVPDPTEGVWAPGLAYIPLAMYYAYRLADVLPPGGTSFRGSDYLSLQITLVWFLVGAGVMLAAVVLPVVMLLESRRER